MSAIGYVMVMAGSAIGGSGGDGTLVSFSSFCALG